MDKFGRAEWDNYNMAVAMLATSRSIDPRTKHGCYIVAPHNKPLITGCNGPIAGVDDDKISLTPPGKYFELIHSEENAILNFNGSLEGATVYVTGHPCSRCFKMLAQKKVKRIVWGPISSVRLDKDIDEWESMKRMIGYAKEVELVEFDGNFWEPFIIMIKYLATKGISPTKDVLSAISNAICDVDLQVEIPPVRIDVPALVTSVDAKGLLGE